jgi:hypothetical protein
MGQARYDGMEWLEVREREWRGDGCNGRGKRFIRAAEGRMPVARDSREREMWFVYKN